MKAAGPPEMPPGLNCKMPEWGVGPSEEGLNVTKSVVVCDLFPCF